MGLNDRSSFLVCGGTETWSHPLVRGKGGSQTGKIPTLRVKLHFHSGESCMQHALFQWGGVHRSGHETRTSQQAESN